MTTAKSSETPSKHADGTPQIQPQNQPSTGQEQRPVVPVRVPDDRTVRVKTTRDAKGVKFG